MKLRVLRNSLRGRQAVGLVLGGILGLTGAVGTLLLGTARFPAAGTSVDVLATVYAAWLVGWVLAPVATGGGDETLRPQHFALLPIGRRRLATGLLAAGFVGVPAVASFVAFAGLFVYGLRLGVAPALVGAIFTVLQLLLVMLVYRVTIAALGSLLTSRKGKELGILLVALTGLSGVGVNYVVESLGPALVAGRASEFATLVRILPSGWGANAVRQAADGRWGTVALLLAGTVALLTALLTAWAALLASSATAAPFRGAAGSRAAAPGTRRRSLLPLTPVGAVAAKELRTWWRDARRRVAILSTIVLALVVNVVPALSGGVSPGRTLPYLAVYVVVAACLQSANLYGFDGSALWHTLVTPGAHRADVRGRQLGWALIVGPVALLLAVVGPAAAGEPDAYPWVLGLAPALLGAGAGVVLLQSVFAAYPLPDQRRTTSPFSSGGRPGCARVLLTLALTVLLAAAAVPVLGIELAGTLTGQPLLQWCGVPVGLGTGALLTWWWGRIAWHRLEARGPELLQNVGRQA
jgi:ABC-2 type transport system permease protein